ncbi:MAG: hypothetical protein ACN4G0_05300 [Polyangiales bacterium]
MTVVLRLAFVALLATSMGCSTESEPMKEPLPTGYEQRRADFFELTIDADPRNTYSEVMRLDKGEAPDESKIRHDLDRLVNREDTSDFKLPGLLWMMYKHASSELLSQELLDDAKTVLLKHKYWPDERLNETEWLPEPEPVDSEYWVPTTDSMVYVTENHFILYASSAYLVGQLYPEETFGASDETGAQKMDTFRPRVMKWLELRYKSGFSEWLSNVYYDEDIPGLVALVEFAEDEEIRTKAAMVLDLILADMALNQYAGNFGSTHGRTYEDKMSASRDNTGSTSKLVFDLNEFGPGNMSSSSLALSTKYLPPRVVYDIANDADRPEMENRQRMGIRLEEAESWGLDLGRFEDGMTFMTLEAYTHHSSILLWGEMLDAYGWWVHDDYKLFRPFEDVLRDPIVGPAFAKGAEKDITRNMRPEVNIYTYRTPSFMLSTAQDWRNPHEVDHVPNENGYGGDQQSIWQATLGMDAVAFTTHPANLSWDGDTPRYWTGYGTMPRAIQVKNVVISLYDVDTDTSLYVAHQPLFTHAFLPKDQFDEADKEGGWFFARKGDGFVALWASDPEADWEPADPEHPELGVHEIIACPDGHPENYPENLPDGPPAHEACRDRESYGDCEDAEDCDKTVWICELGSAADYADYDAFKAAILAAPLDVDVGTLSVDYQSPSQGRLVMGWDGPLTQDGEPVDVSDYARYDNPYGNSPFRDDVISLAYEDPQKIYEKTSMNLDWANLTREVSHDLE